MSAVFAAASSQRVVNSVSPFIATGYPITVGLWATRENSSQFLWSYSDSSVDNHYLAIKSSTTSFTIAARAGGTENAVAVQTLTLSRWAFVVARFIASNNRKIDCICFDNGSNAQIGHGSSTTSRAPSSLDRLSIGSLESATPSGFLDGKIAEIWTTNTDIQNDGDQLKDELLIKLALSGPFSIPHIAKDIIEYRSFRSGIESSQDGLGEIYHGAAGRQTWVNTNGVTLRVHPPLSYQYKQPPNVPKRIGAIPI